jgi:hypothetical protein
MVNFAVNDSLNENRFVLRRGFMGHNFDGYLVLITQIQRARKIHLNNVDNNVALRFVFDSRSTLSGILFMSICRPCPVFPSADGSCRYLWGLCTGAGTHLTFCERNVQ